MKKLSLRIWDKESKTHIDLTCKRGSVGQSEGLSIPRSSVRFRQKPDNSNSHEFELHRPSNKGTKLLLKVIKAIIITTKLMLGFLSNLQYQKRLIFSHLFVLCMHCHANFIYSATASSDPTHCQSPWLHHRAVEWHKTELMISGYVYYYTEKKCLHSIYRSFRTISKNM